MILLLIAKFYFLNREIEKIGFEIVDEIFERIRELAKKMDQLLIDLIP